MNPEEITALMKYTLVMMLEVAAPFLFISLIVGSLISLIQSYTHIQEPTLSFAPKILGLCVALLFLFPWIVKMLVRFTTDIWVYQWDKIVTFSHYAC